MTGDDDKPAAGDDVAVARPTRGQIADKLQVDLQAAILTSGAIDPETGLGDPRLIVEQLCQLAAGIAIGAGASEVDYLRFVKTAYDNMARAAAAARPRSVLFSPSGQMMPAAPSPKGRNFPKKPGGNGGSPS